MLISADSISKTYPGMTRPALNNLTLEVDEGEIIAFIGRNGAGKSTAFDILAGFMHPDSGSVTYGVKRHEIG